ncbi:MAG: hypothetical protein IJE10_08855 [Clostridia bacterium]|nr:hypothetical protein [Clostridia bacterium]
MSITTLSLILLMIVLFSWQSLFSRLQATAYPGNENDAPIVFSVFYGLIITFITFISAGFIFEPSKATVLLGVLNALIVLGYNICLLGASDRGNYSITIIFMIFGGILIPLFISLFKGDTLNAVQWISILVMLLSFILMNLPQKGATKQKSKKGFLLLCVLLFLFNGFYGAIMAWQQEFTNQTEQNEMIIVTYFCLALFSFLFMLFKNRGQLQSFKQTKKSVLFLIIASSVGTFAQKLMLYLVGPGGVQEGILYTFDNGGAMILSIVYSFCIFKERLTKIQIFSLLMALAALIALSVA